MNLYYFFIAYSLFIFVDIIPLAKKKKRKEVFVYLVFLFIACTLSILIHYGVEVPSPISPIKIIMNRG